MNKKQFRSLKNRLVDEYIKNANTTFSMLNEVSDKLSEILVTASLAYVGLAAFLFNDPNAIQKMNQWQKNCVCASLVLFILSIIFGIIRHMVVISFCDRVAKLNEKAAININNAKCECELRCTQKQCRSRLNEKENRHSKYWPMVVQILCFGLGCLSIMIYIFVVMNSQGE